MKSTGIAVAVSADTDDNNSKNKMSVDVNLNSNNSIKSEGNRTPTSSKDDGVHASQRSYGTHSNQSISTTSASQNSSTTTTNNSGTKKKSSHVKRFRFNTIQSEVSNTNNTVFRRKSKTQQIKEHESTIRRSTTLLDEFSALMTNEFPTDDPKSTTLHVACLKHYSDALIVDHLLKQGPDAVSKPNSHNDLPLHYAMKDTSNGGVTERVVDSLLSLHPQAVNHTNNDDCLPIHIACHVGGPSIYAIRKLVEENSNSLMTKCQLRLPYDPKAKEYIVKEKRFDAAQKYLDDDDDHIANDHYGNCFWNVFSIMSSGQRKDSFEENTMYTKSRSIDGGYTYDGEIQNVNEYEETDFTPLHLAVLSGAAPDVIEYILNTKPECLKLHTNQGRKAIDCAKFAVIHQLASPPPDDESTVVSTPIKNIFAAIEILETFERNQRKKEQLSSFISSRSIRLERSYRSLLHNNSTGNNDALTSIDTNYDVDSMNTSLFDPKKEWKKISSFSKRMLSSFSVRTPLGPEVEMDDEELLGVPSDFDTLPKLAHLCIDIDLPVGFQRLRWAFLSSDSNFVNDEIHKKKLGYTE